jgi:hypothetical protein
LYINCTDTCTQTPICGSKTDVNSTCKIEKHQNQNTLYKVFPKETRGNKKIVKFEAENSPNSTKNCHRRRDWSPEERRRRDRSPQERRRRDRSPEDNRRTRYSYEDHMRRRHEDPQGPYTVDLSPRNNVFASLINNRQVITLFDSGASFSIVAQSFVDNNPGIAMGPIQKLKEPIPLFIADGSKIVAKERINFELKMGLIVITVKALIVPQDIGTIDVIVGTDDLKDKEATLDFTTNRITFRKGYTTVMKTTRETIIPPYSTRTVHLAGKVKSPFKNKNIVIKAEGFGRQVLPNRSFVTLKRGGCEVILFNQTQRPIRVRSGIMLATLDLPTSYSLMVPLLELHPDKDGYSEGVYPLLRCQTSDYKPPRPAYKPQGYYHQTNKTRHTRIRQPQGKQKFRGIPGSKEFYSSMTKRDLRQYNLNKHPFLELDDPKLEKNPYQILKEELDLKTDSVLSDQDRPRLMYKMQKHLPVWSCYGEIGKTDHVIKLEIDNKEPKYIRSYPCSMADRELIDKEMRRLQLLGVIEEGKSSFSSPVMLVAKKGNNTRKRVVLDLRVLNSRIRKVGFGFPLINDCLEQIGRQGSQYLSAIDITDAFFGLKLSKESQRWTGISTYPGGKRYFFNRLPMGLSVSPAEFSSFIVKVLSEIPDFQQFTISYVDDILIHSKTFDEHLEHLDKVLAVLKKHNLKIKPSKAQICKKQLDYLGYQIIIKEGRPYLKIQQTKVDAINRMKPPKNIKGVRQFCGAVNYLSRFLPDLTDLLSPIRKLSRKNSKQKWDQQCQKNFQTIKNLITKAPILHLPREDYIWRLYIDTSRVATGCSIYQVPHKDSKDERLIGYYSKSMPTAAKNFSVSELEATGILYVLQALKSLKNTYIQIYTDHSALVHLMRSSQELPTPRLKRVMEKMGDYIFDLNYHCGSGLSIADWLSRSSYEDLEEPKFQVALTCQATSKSVDIVKAVTRSMAQRMKEENNTKEGEDPDSMEQEEQEEQEEEEPEEDTEDDTTESEDTSEDKHKITPYQKRNTLIGQQLSRDDVIDTPEDTFIPISSGSTNTHKDSQTKHPEPDDTVISSNEVKCDPEVLELKDMKPLFDKEYYFKPPKRLPRQCELKGFIREVKKRALRDYSLPLEVQEIAQAQRTDPFFKEIYEYLMLGVPPPKPRERKCIMALAEEYILYKNVLFKILPRRDNLKFDLALALPEKCAPLIFYLNHDSLWSGHLGVRKTYAKLKQKYYMPNLYELLKTYIQSCNKCQQLRVPSQDEPQHLYKPRVLANFEPFAHLHLDVKYMHESSAKHKFILVIIDTCTRYAICEAMRENNAVNVANILMEKVFLIHGFPKSLHSDQGTEFDNALLRYLTEALKINHHFCTVGAHESVLSERCIQTISNILTTKLEDKGTNWNHYLSAATYAYNSSPHSMLGQYSPFELVFGRLPKEPLQIDENTLSGPEPVDAEEYITSLKNRLAQVGQTALEIHNRNQRAQATARARQINRKPLFNVGETVYLLFPRGAELFAKNIKFQGNYIGPLVITGIVDDRLVTLSDLSGNAIFGVHSIKRLKRAYFRVHNKTATNISDIKQAIKDLDEARKKNPNISIEDQPAMMCLSNGHYPQHCNLNHYLTPKMEKQNLINLQEVDSNNSTEVIEKNLLKAATCERNHKQANREEKHNEKTPGEGEDLIASKARVKKGVLQVLLIRQKDPKCSFWLDLDPNNKDYIVRRVTNSCKWTGRILLLTSRGDKSKLNQENVDPSQYTLRVHGSMKDLKMEDFALEELRKIKKENQAQVEKGSLEKAENKEKRVDKLKQD